MRTVRTILLSSVAILACNASSAEPGSGDGADDEGESEAGADEGTSDEGTSDPDASSESSPGEGSTSDDAEGTDSDEAGTDDTGNPNAVYEFDFDEDPVMASPASFSVALGQWQVEADGDAVSAPNVLRQSESVSDPEFPRIALDEPSFADVRLSVQCRPETGVIDQACGAMVRVQDEDNYIITRANVLESNLRLYRVVDGVREQFASVDVEVVGGEWHELAIEAIGTSFVVSWDGSALIEAQDDTFASGGVGLWTKADSVTAFDDLRVEAL